MYVYDDFHMKEDIIKALKQYSRYDNQGDPACDKDKLELDLMNEFAYDYDDLKNFDNNLKDLVDEGTVFETDVDGIKFYSYHTLTSDQVDALRPLVNEMFENPNEPEEDYHFNLSDTVNKIDSDTEGEFDLFNLYSSLALSDAEKLGVAAIAQENISNDEKAKKLFDMLSSIQESGFEEDFDYKAVNDEIKVDESYDNADDLYDIQGNATKQKAIDEFEQFLSFANRSSDEPGDVQVDTRERAEMIRPYLEDKGFVVNIEDKEEGVVLSWVK